MEEESRGTGMAQGFDPEFTPPKVQLANQLRKMMATADSNTKCTLCKAAEELEKSSSSQWDNKWLLMIVMLIFGFSSFPVESVDPQLVEACMGISRKEQSNESPTDSLHAD